jgi:hypothetical protein
LVFTSMGFDVSNITYWGEIMNDNMH